MRDRGSSDNCKGNTGMEEGLLGMMSSCGAMNK